MSFPGRTNAVARRVTVLGDGSWGTAITLLLARGGNDVTLWSAFPEHARELEATRENTTFLPGFPIPDSVRIVSETRQAVSGRDFIIAAVPSLYLREVLGRFEGMALDGIVVSVAKGIEYETFLTPSQVIRELAGDVPVCVLSGPSHAEEVARQLPTTVVAASSDVEVAGKVQVLFTTDRFRVYTNTDVIGVELAAAVKNIIAIAAGICDGLGFGDNAKSALLVRGAVEMARFGASFGARGETFGGLAGIGDLITTCISPFGRNRAVGLEIGRGRKLDQVLQDMNMVAEGVETTRSVKAMADRRGIEMPITAAVHAILFEERDPLQAAGELMARAVKAEM